jgi:hypothetical protein
MNEVNAKPHVIHAQIGPSVNRDLSLSGVHLIPPPSIFPALAVNHFWKTAIANFKVNFPPFLRCCIDTPLIPARI